MCIMFAFQSPGTVRQCIALVSSSVSSTSRACPCAGVLVNTCAVVNRGGRSADVTDRRTAHVATSRSLSVPCTRKFGWLIEDRVMEKEVKSIPWEMRRRMERPLLQHEVDRRDGNGRRIRMMMVGRRYLDDVRKMDGGMDGKNPTARMGRRKIKRKGAGNLTKITRKINNDLGTDVVC